MVLSGFWKLTEAQNWVETSFELELRGSFEFQG